MASFLIGSNLNIFFTEIVAETGKEVRAAPHFVRPVSDTVAKEWCFTSLGQRFAKKYAAEWSQEKMSSKNLRHSLSSILGAFKQGLLSQVSKNFSAYAASSPLAEEKKRDREEVNRAKTVNKETLIQGKACFKFILNRLKQTFVGQQQ